MTRLWSRGSRAHTLRGRVDPNRLGRADHRIRGSSTAALSSVVVVVAVVAVATTGTAAAATATATTATAEARSALTEGSVLPGDSCPSYGLLHVG